MKSQTAFIFRKEGTKNIVAQPFINLRQHYPEVAESYEKCMGFAVRRLRFRSQLFCQFLNLLTLNTYLVKMGLITPALLPQRVL